MVLRLLAGMLLLLAVPAAPAAAAGDPIMPLDEVRPGMQCKGYSVIRGTEPAEFDVEIIDVVGGESGTRLLVEVSGEAVEETGVGAGFSGSPIYCPGSDGRPRNAGAISEGVGEYGGHTVLATPIEAILTASPEPAGEHPLASPLTVGGLSRPVFRALQRRARRLGRTLLQAPPLPPLSPPPSGLRPGSAISIGLASGDVSVGAIGTVAYVDGDRVWALGHAFDGVGRRNLILQNAYVATVVANPLQSPELGGTYKLAGATSEAGTVTDDVFSGVAGRLGVPPATIPVRIFAHDDDTGEQTLTRAEVADETAVGTPTGWSGLSFVGPLAVAQAASSLHPYIPSRLMGTMCLRLVLRERSRPVRVCNRYVSDGTAPGDGYGNVVASLASSDAYEVLALLDSYKPADLHVTELTARLRLRRGRHQAFIRSVRVPRRARAGRMVTARMRIQRVRGRRSTVRFRFRAPSRAGRRTLVFRGTDADLGEGDLFGVIELDFGGGSGDATGPRTLEGLVRSMRRIQRYDGVRVNGRRAFRSPRLRIGGRASTSIRIVR